MKLAEYYSLLDFDNPYYGREWESNYKFFSSYMVKIEREHKGDVPEEVRKELYNFFQDTIDIHTKVYILPTQVERIPGTQEVTNGKVLRYATIEDIFKNKPMED